MRRHPEYAPQDEPQDEPQKAPKLERIRCVQIKGSGALLLVLNGTGHIRVRRGRGDDFQFEGRGTPRFLSGECILLNGADGRLEIRGLQLELEFKGGSAEIALEGEFQCDPPRRMWAQLRRTTWKSRAA